MSTWETAALMCSSPSWLRCFIYPKKKSLRWHKSPPSEASDHHCPQRYTPGTLLSYNETKRAAHRQAYNHPVYSVCICVSVYRAEWVCLHLVSLFVVCHSENKRASVLMLICVCAYKCVFLPMCRSTCVGVCVFMLPRLRMCHFERFHQLLLSRD